jgi:hypothetical protein
VSCCRGTRSSDLHCTTGRVWVFLRCSGLVSSTVLPGLYQDPPGLHWLDDACDAPPLISLPPHHPTLLSDASLPPCDAPALALAVRYCPGYFPVLYCPLCSVYVHRALPMLSDPFHCVEGVVLQVRRQAEALDGRKRDAARLRDDNIELYKKIRCSLGAGRG